MKPPLLIQLLLWLLCAPFHQTNAQAFGYISEKDSAPQTNIMPVTQDSQGFTWYATTSGLSVSVPSATYTNLPVGEPWWKTWYAYLTYIILVGAAIYLLTRFFWLRTALKKENELYQAKLDFFTNISHEIRTHLSLIVGPLEKTYGLLAENQAAMQQLSRARNNSEKLMQLVNELLDFRKIQNEGIRLAVHEYDLIKTIKNILSSFEHIAADKEITIRFIYPDPTVKVWFDLMQIQKVFYNLLGNAFKFTPEGGWVSVEITQSPNDVAISIINTGSGIAAKDLDHLFDNFFQADNNGRSHGGHGIGLALSKGIVDLHRGTLNVTSRQHSGDPYHQTSFTLRLLAGNSHYSSDQLAKSEAVFPSYSDFGIERLNRPETSVPTDKKYTILVIEDNDELRAFEKELFSETYSVLDAANGADGLQLAFDHVPDLVLCDVMMPEQNGIQVCSELKNDIRTSHIPVILLTARSALSQVVEGLKAGADDYLVKPFDPNVLFLKMDNLIKVREELRRSYKESLAPASDEELVEDVEDEFIAKLRNMVIENISDPDFGVNEMAFQVGMSVSVLYRKLRSLTGVTVNDFMKTVKMQRALGFLESGNYHVSEVAIMVGYEDVRYFSKEFRKIYGKNPSLFRSQSAQERGGS